MNMYEEKTTDFKEKIELLQKELDKQKVFLFIFFKIPKVSQSNLNREINATRLERKTFRSFIHGLMKNYDN